MPLEIISKKKAGNQQQHYSCTSLQRRFWNTNSLNFICTDVTKVKEEILEDSSTGILFPLLDLILKFPFTGGNLSNNCNFYSLPWC